MSKTRTDRLGYQYYHKSTDTDTYMIVYCAGVTGCA